MAPTPSIKSGQDELRQARGYGRVFLIYSFVFSIFVNLLMLVGPLFMMQVYDRVLGSRSVETLTALTLLVGFLYVMMGILDYARGRVLARFGARFQSALQDRVFDATVKRAVIPSERAAASGAMSDLDAIRTVFSSPAPLALLDLPWAPIFVVAIFMFHPMLGWLAVVGGIVLIVVTIANQMFTTRRTAAAAQKTQTSDQLAEQARASAELLRSQGMTEPVRKRWLGQRDDALASTLEASDWTGGFLSFTKAFRLFLQSAMLAVGAYYVLQDQISGGAMIAGSILMGRALAPIEQAIQNWPAYQRARQGWKRLALYLAATPTDAKHTPLPTPPAHLQISSVSLLPPGGKTAVIRAVSAEVKPGQALGIIGKSGAGKSSLGRAVLGLWPTNMGEIRLGGATLDQYDTDALGRHIGYLPQDVTLFSGTITENIARLAESPDVDAVIIAAKRANAHEMILGLPDGYDTVISGRDGQLSGGQKQRIGMARALYGDPVLLLLDEPNSALDSAGSDALNRAVRGFKSMNRAVVIMTHRPAAISECDLLLVLDGGRATAFGPRDEVLKSVTKNAQNIQSALEKGATS